MPLARRFSNSSVGSNSSRRLSLPSTAPSSTNVNPEKLEKMMGRRRKTRQQTQQSGDKENQSLQIQAPQSPDEKGNQTLKVPQSPTPYWKGKTFRDTSRVESFSWDTFTFRLLYFRILSRSFVFSRTGAWYHVPSRNSIRQKEETISQSFRLFSAQEPRSRK